MNAQRPFLPAYRYWPLFLLVLCVLPGAFQGGAWAAFGLVGGVIGFFWAWIEDRKAPEIRRDWAIFIALFLIYAFAQAPFSVWPETSFPKTLQVTSILVPLLLLSSPTLWRDALTDRRLLFLAMAMGTGCLALYLEIRMDGPNLLFFQGKDSTLADYNRGLSYIMILFWPLLGALGQGRYKRFIPLFLIMVLPVLLLTLSRATLVAFLIGGLVLCAAFAWPTLVKWFLGACALLSCAWPFVMIPFFKQYPEIIAKLPASWLARAEIWDYVSYRVMERPFFGWGVGSSPYLPSQEPNGALYVLTKDTAAHPHNAILQLWVELGVFGLLVGMVFIILTIKGVERLSPRHRPFAYAAFAYTYIISLCAYNLWADSLLAAFVFALVFFSALPQKKSV